MWKRCLASSFRFSSTLESMIKQLSDLSSKKNPSLNNLGQQVQKLTTYIPQMEFQQLKTLAEAANKAQAFEEALATKSFQRLTELLLSNQIQVVQSLSILDLIITTDKPYSTQFQSQIVSFLAAISQFPDLSPEQIALATLNYGIVVGVSQRKNSDIELNLTNHIKLKIDQFQSVDLRHSSLGISLGEFQSSSLYDLIERQAQLINIIYEDLVRIVAAFNLGNRLTSDLLKLMEEQTLEKVEQQSPKVVCLAAMTYKQLQNTNPEIYVALERAFLKNVDNCNTFEKIQIYSTFGAVEHESSAIWMSLEQDLPELLEFEDPNVVAMLIVDCIKSSHLLEEEVVSKLLQYIVESGPKLSEWLRSEIYDILEEKKLLTEVLETTLLHRS